jgi:hypothetical protein
MREFIQFVLELFFSFGHAEVGWRFLISILAGAIVVGLVLWLFQDWRGCYQLSTVVALIAIAVGLWWDSRKR